MSAALNANTPDPSPQAADPEAEFHRQTIHDLTTWCADVAFRLRNAAEAAETTDDLVRLATAFDAAARGVRRSVMLARHIARPPRPEPAAPSPARKPRPTPNLRLADAPTSEAPARESPDQPDQPDPAPDNRPIAEQIDAIRRELDPAAAAATTPAPQPGDQPATPQPTPTTHPHNHRANTAARPPPPPNG